MAICSHPTAFGVAVPGPQLGEVHIKLYDAPSEMIIPAHNSSIAALAINSDSTMVATASAKGTLLRVWDSSSGLQLYELRRGVDIAAITCLNFNQISSYLICSSDKGTIHVFSIVSKTEPQMLLPPSPSEPHLTHEENAKEQKIRNKKSSIRSLVPSFLRPRYLEGQWGFLQIRGVGKCICGFTPDSSKIVVRG